MALICLQACKKLLEDARGHCPLCRQAIDFEKAQRIKKIRSARPKASASFEYNRMSPSLWSEIQRVETLGSYGSKIQSLVRHLAWIQQREPGAKSIVFSAWADVSYLCPFHFEVTEPYSDLKHY